MCCDNIPDFLDFSPDFTETGFSSPSLASLEAIVCVGLCVARWGIVVCGTLHLQLLRTVGDLKMPGTFFKWRPSFQVQKRMALELKRKAV